MIKNREQYRAALIEAAQRHLDALAKCPKCNQGKQSDGTTGTRQVGMEVELLWCGHPFHDLRWSDGDFTQLAMGLPRHTNFDQDWVRRMQEAALNYAVQQGLEPPKAKHKILIYHPDHPDRPVGVVLIPDDLEPREALRRFKNDNVGNPGICRLELCQIIAEVQN